MQTIEKAERTVVGGVRAGAAQATAGTAEEGTGEPRGEKTRAMLRATLGDDIFTSWFHTLEFEAFDAKIVRVSVPVKFLKNWIQSHYSDDLLACCRAEFKGAEKVDVILRQPHARAAVHADGQPANGVAETGVNGARSADTARGSGILAAAQAVGRTSVGGFEGSPLDPRYTFDSFVVGAANRMAHAGAVQVADTAMDDGRGYNPLYIHSAVGLEEDSPTARHRLGGEAARTQRAGVLYPTAERFRYQFVEALRSQDPLAFKEKFRLINILLIDDLEFMHGERTEQEFEHIINSLLDGGRQVVVASARAPNHVERLNEAHALAPAARACHRDRGARPRPPAQGSGEAARGEACPRSLVRIGARDPGASRRASRRERARAGRCRDNASMRRGSTCAPRSRPTSPRP